MTENEYLEMPWRIEDTIENLKTIKEHLIATVLKANLDGKGKQDAKEVEFDFNRAIQALEEIQQYRAIGTVEELEWCKDASHWKELFKEKLEKYEAIGTVEEIKSYFNDNRKAGYKHGYSDGYAKAIDEFMSRVKKAYETMESIPTVEKATVNTIMLGIAEKMKAGGTE